MADPFAVQAGARGAGRRIRGGGGGVQELGTGFGLGHGKVAHEIIAFVLSSAEAQKISQVLLKHIAFSQREGIERSARRRRRGRRREVGRSCSRHGCGAPDAEVKGCRSEGVQESGAAMIVAEF